MIESGLSMLRRGIKVLRRRGICSILNVSKKDRWARKETRVSGQ